MWQGAVVTAAVWLTLRFARKIDAATRYVVWWMVLAAILALPLAPRLAALRPKAQSVVTGPLRLRHRSRAFGI